MLREPYEHQRRGLQWAIGRSRIALFWKMRLGKSLVAIRWVKHRRAYPALIVCPLDVVETWLQELRLEGFGCEVLRGYKAKPSGSVDWSISNYESIRGNQALRDYPWQAVLLDESDVIRNPKAKITKACIVGFRNVPNRAILSGTPAPESLLEYFSQMQFLLGSFLGYHNYWHFRAALFQPGFRGWKWTPKKGSERRIAEGVSIAASVLTEKDVNMPCREVQEIRRLDMPQQLRSVYRHAERQFVLRHLQTVWTPVVQTWLARLVGGCHPLARNDYKIEALLQLLAGELHGQQAVIWCCFNSEIDCIARRLSGSYGIIRGTVSTETRADVNNAFQAGKLRYLLCQPRCARYGRNFSAASVSIFYSLPWDLKTYQQAKSRVIHPSKKEPVLTLHLQARQSLDEDMLAALRTKTYNVESFRMLVMRNLYVRLRG